MLPKNSNYDLLVIGGGINGAAIANYASAAGAKVALVDKNDWASGTSSKSTKLLHGGIRYLENLEFDLVKESLKERYIQWRAAPYLVKPLRFIIPVYQKWGRPLWVMKLGVWLYDLLSGKYSLGGHTVLSVDEIVRLVPGIKTEGLCGGVSYFDAQMDDARICLENVLMAKAQGASVLNYTEMVEFIKDNGRTSGARMRDVRTGQSFDIMAKQVIVAAGPWADRLRAMDSWKVKSWLRPTKGVHVVVRGSIGGNAYLLQNKKDNRIFFVIPFHGNMLIGTTDTDYADPPDDVKVEQKDIDYLLTQVQDIFPGIDCSRENIITTFAGLRPLVHEPGAPSKVSRKHVIDRNLAGVYFVMGGKYTTYRAIALEAVGKALPDLKNKLSRQEQYTLYGSMLGPIDVTALTLRYGVEAACINHLISVYGGHCEDVLRLTANDHGLKAKICTCTPTIRAQVKYALDTEMAVTVDDIFIRRLGLEYRDCPTRQCRLVIEEMIRNP